MFRIQRINRLSALALLPWGGLAQAALHDRGNGLIYDDVLDVTWLQDANLAATRNFGVYGIRSDGSFSRCDIGMEWVDAMNAAGYKGFTDWQLPMVSPIDGNQINTTLSYDGSTDTAFNISAPGSAFPGSQASDLAHLHYQSLSNQGWYDVNGNRNDQGCPDDANGCLRNTGPFINLQPGVYIFADNCPPVIPVPTPYLAFDFRSGQQGWEGTFLQPVQQFRALPYHPGDVAATGVKSVPTLSPWPLAALGGLLLMLGGYRLRRRVFR